MQLSIEISTADSRFSVLRNHLHDPLHNFFSGNLSPLLSHFPLTSFTAPFFEFFSDGFYGGASRLRVGKGMGGKRISGIGYFIIIVFVCVALPSSKVSK